MSFHRNAKLGLAGRYALVCAIEEGMTLKAAAAAFSVSPATAHRWWHRWLEAGEEARATLSCLFDRSSRPHRSPRQLAPELAEAICACRRKTGWGPRLVAGATGFCHSTVWKVLERAGSRGRREPRGSRPTATSGPAPATCCTWTPASTRASAARPPRHRRPLSQDRQHRDGSTSCTRSSTTTPASPTPRSTPTRSRDRRRLPRARARLLRRPRISRATTDDRQRLDLRHAAARTRAARPSRDPAPHHQALPAAHQRQGRALPPNDGARVGLRARLPLTPRTAPRPATLARPLQRARPHSSTRRPTPISRVHNVCGQDT